MKDPLLKEVWNAIEDYMIERNWLMLYPGAHKNFTATEARCCAQYLAQYPNHPDMAKDLRVAGAVGLTWCRSIYFGLKTPLSADCLKTMPPSLQQRVSDWFYDIVDVETTLDCLEAARRIVQDIRANPFDPADPPADPNHNPMGGNQGGPGQPGSGGGQGQGQGGREGQAPGQRPAPLGAPGGEDGQQQAGKGNRRHRLGLQHGHGGGDGRTHRKRKGRAPPGSPARQAHGGEAGQTTVRFSRRNSTVKLSSARENRSSISSTSPSVAMIGGEKAMVSLPRARVSTPSFSPSAARR